MSAFVNPPKKLLKKDNTVDVSTDTEVAGFEKAILTQKVWGR